MLLDWITARLPLHHLTPNCVEVLRSHADTIQRLRSDTGELVWQTTAWDSVRSDSHQIAFRITGEYLFIQGAPGRVVGDGDAVFGSGPVAALDVLGSLRPMIRLASEKLGVLLPMLPHQWEVRRIDVTENLLLGSLDEVHDGLRVLRNTNGGRYRVTNQDGETVYWSSKSTLRKGKAYAKGPHLRYLMARWRKTTKAKANKEANNTHDSVRFESQYTGRLYTPMEIEAANKVLRLELTLGRHWFDRHDKKWWQITADELKAEWKSYFERMIGGAEMKTDADIRERVMNVAPSEGQGKAAYATWLLIHAEGWEKARTLVSDRSWYRHLKILRAAGLGDADISAGTVVPLRRRVIEARSVASWAELLAA